MALSTLGADIWVVSGGASNTVPTTGWKSGWGEAITDFPGLTSSTETIDVTPIIEDKFIRYVAGLSDTGGAIELTLNVGALEQQLYDAVVTEADISTSGNSAGILWFMLVLPNYDKGWAFKGELGQPSVPAVAPNGAMQEALSIIPNFVYGKTTKPTTSTPLLTT